MKRFVLFAAALFSASLSFAQYRAGYSELDDSETVSAFRSHVEYLAGSSLEGRAAGSQGETEAAAYVRDVMEEYGVEILYPGDDSAFGIKRESGDTLVSRNVVGCIQGYDRTLRDRYIVIGARLDNIGTRTINIDGVHIPKTYYGANGNASGIAMMLELARMLKTNSLLLRRSVIFVAFGSSLEGNAGSWYFLNRTFKSVDKIDAMINLDVLGRGIQGFYAFTSSNADLTRAVNRVNSTLQPIKPELTAAEPFASDHRMFYASQIPSVLFTTGMYPEYGTERDTPSIVRYEDMERELEYIYNFSMEMVNGTAPSFTSSGDKTSGSMDDVVPYYDCDYKPTFLGSPDPKVFLEKWVYAYLKYPQAAVSRGIQGRVLVDFIIDEKGKVRDVKVLKGVDPLLDDEAVKVVAASPDWKPARLQGKKVKSEMSLYVEFKLEKKKK